MKRLTYILALFILLAAPGPAFAQQAQLVGKDAAGKVREVGTEGDALKVKASSTATGAVYQGATAVSNVAVSTLGNAASTARRGILVQNLGPNPIYLCLGDAVCTTAKGIQVPAGEHLFFEIGPAVTVYAIAATAAQVAPADTRWVEFQ